MYKNVKYLLLFLFMFTIIFINIDGVKAACEYGIICNYEYCGRRGTGSDKGYLATSCPENSGNVILSVAYTCSSTDKNAKDCDSFVSWAKIARNLGTGYENVNFGNYNDIFYNADFLKEKFNKASQFSCPQLWMSLTNTFDDNTYSFSYTNNGGKVITPNGTSDKKYSSQECINQGTSTSDIDARLQEIVTKRASDTSVDQGKEEAENNSGFELGGKENNSSSGEVNIQAITEWANNHGYGNSVTSIGDPCTVINPELQKMLSSAFWLISVVGIVLLVVMTAIGFIKAIVGSDDEKLKDAFKHLVTRIIVVIILLLLPMLLGFIITLINDSAEGEVKIGEDGNIFCDVTSGSSDSSSDDDSGTAVIDENTGEMTQ